MSVAFCYLATMHEECDVYCVMCMHQQPSQNSAIYTYSLARGPCYARPVTYSTASVEHSARLNQVRQKYNVLDNNNRAKIRINKDTCRYVVTYKMCLQVTSTVSTLDSHSDNSASKYHVERFTWSGQWACPILKTTNVFM